MVAVETFNAKQKSDEAGVVFFFASGYGGLNTVPNIEKPNE